MLRMGESQVTCYNAVLIRRVFLGVRVRYNMRVREFKHFFLRSKCRLLSGGGCTFKLTGTPM